MSRVNLCPLPNLRSLLFVPGSREDSSRKPPLPGRMRSCWIWRIRFLRLSRTPPRARVGRLARSSRSLTFIRINHPSCGELEKDLAVLAPHAAQAVMLPKVVVSRTSKQSMRDFRHSSAIEVSTGTRSVFGGDRDEHRPAQSFRRAAHSRAFVARPGDCRGRRLHADIGGGDARGARRSRMLAASSSAMHEQQE